MEYIINQEVMNLKNLLDESGLVSADKDTKALGEALKAYMKAKGLSHE